MDTVPELLKAAATTYAERRAVYGPSEIKFGQVMTALFPDGLTCTTEADFIRLGLFVQIVSKLCRYSQSVQSSPHLDSIHDLGVYAFMLEHADRTHHD